MNGYDYDYDYDETYDPRDYCRDSFEEEEAPVPGRPPGKRGESSKAEDYSVYEDLGHPKNPKSRIYEGGEKEYSIYDDLKHPDNPGNPVSYKGIPENLIPPGKKAALEKRAGKRSLAEDLIRKATKKADPQTLKKRLAGIYFIIYAVLFYVFSPGPLFGAERSINPVFVMMNYITRFPLALLLIGVISGIFTGFIYKYLKDNSLIKSGGFEFSKDNTHGSARFASKEELEGAVRFEPLQRPAGIVLGKAPGEDIAVSALYEKGAARNGNVMVFGASGSGKTYCVVKPGILTRISRKESYVVTDPSGELYRDTSALAEREGYEVRVLNLLDFGHSDGWNPLSGFKAEDPDAVTDLTTLIDSIMQNTADTKSGDNYFYNNEENLLKCLVFYAALSKNFKGEEYERNLATVYDMLVQLAARENSFPEIEELLADDPSDPALSPWVLFSSESDKLKKNFVSGLNARLNRFENPAFKEIFRHDEIKPENAGKKPCAYYVIFDEKNKTYKFVLNMFFSCFFTSLIREAKRNPNLTNRLDVPVYFILDEAPSIGKIPDFKEILANVRKYGISITYISQSYGFLEAVYETDRECRAILGNCDTWLAIGTNDEATARVLSTRIGTATVRTESTRESGFSAASLLRDTGAKSIASSGRDLMTLHEVFTETDAIILSRQKNAYRAEKYAFTNHFLAPFTEDPENKRGSGEHMPLWKSEKPKEYHYGLAAISGNLRKKPSAGTAEISPMEDFKGLSGRKPITKSSKRR